MVFQDFDILQERRRQDRQRKLKKRIIIAVVILVLVGIAAAAAFAFISTKDSTKNEAKKSDNDGKPKDNKPPSTPANDKPPSTPPANDKPPSTPPANDKPPLTPPTNDKDGKRNDDKSKPQVVSKEFVQSVCEGSTYKGLCAITLTKNLEKNPDSVKQPKQLVKSFITSTNDELDKALTKAGSIQLKTEADKKAFGVCQELMGDAKDELQSTADKVEKIDPANLPTNGDLDTQLSAVMSYQEACVDSFSEGQTKNDFRTTFNTSQVYTSNSLAMVRQLATLRELSSKDNNNNNNNNKKPQAKRRLLQTGFPNWLNNEQRRLLKEEGGDEKSKKPTPNVTVAQDGSGKFKTISEALAATPEKFDGRYVIFVKAGTYVENVKVTKKMVNLTIYGEGSQKSIITGSKNTADGIPPYLTASFVAAGRGFMAKFMGFRNTAGPDKQQALAARISSDRAIFLNCRFEGYQNTLYVQTHRQFYRSCVIKGTMDFIFGDAASVFQNCEIYAMKPKDNQKNTITAQGRKDNFETTGIVIQSSKIMPDESFKVDAKKFKSYLGRPTKRYSRTIIMETQIEDFIDPAGWLEFEGQKDFAVDTLFYGEFKNTGPGAKTQSRVKWAGRKDINKDEAMKYTVGTFLKGSWVKESGAPVRMELGS